MALPDPFRLSSPPSEGACEKRTVVRRGLTPLAGRDGVADAARSECRVLSLELPGFEAFLRLLLPDPSRCGVAEPEPLRGWDEAAFPVRGGKPALSESTVGLEGLV